MLFATYSNRALEIFGFVLCLVAMLIAVLFMEGYLGLDPCPLCVLDRVIVIAIGLLFLLAALHNPVAMGHRVYAGLCALLSVAGITVAARHIWLQNLPPALVPDCAPGLDYLVKNFPLLESLSVIWNTSGACADIAWTFLGLSIPWQTLLLFVALLLLSLWIALRAPATSMSRGTNASNTPNAEN